MNAIRKAALVAATIPLSIVGLEAAPASAVNWTPTCTTWNDNNTYGAYCSSPGMGGYQLFNVVALCNNGRWVDSGTLLIGGGEWGYAYCSSVGGSLYQGKINFS